MRSISVKRIDVDLIQTLHFISDLHSLEEEEKKGRKITWAACGARTSLVCHSVAPGLRWYLLPGRYPPPPILLWGRCRDPRRRSSLDYPTSYRSSRQLLSNSAGRLPLCSRYLQNSPCARIKDLWRHFVESSRPLWINFCRHVLPVTIRVSFLGLHQGPLDNFQFITNRSFESQMILSRYMYLHKLYQSEHRC